MINYSINFGPKERFSKEINFQPLASTFLFILSHKSQMFLKCFINFLKIFISKNNPNKATVMQEIKCSGFVKHLVGDVLCFLV